MQNLGAHLCFKKKVHYLSEVHIYWPREKGKATRQENHLLKVLNLIWGHRFWQQPEKCSLWGLGSGAFKRKRGKSIQVTLVVYQELWLEGNLSFTSHWFSMNFSFCYRERNIFYIVLEKHSYLGRSLKSSFSANNIFLANEPGQCNLFVQQDGVTVVISFHTCNWASCIWSDNLQPTASSNLPNPSVEISGVIHAYFIGYRRLNGNTHLHAQLRAPNMGALIKFQLYGGCPFTCHTSSLISPKAERTLIIK